MTLDELFFSIFSSEIHEIKVYCPICKTDQGHFNPCAQSIEEDLIK